MPAGVASAAIGTSPELVNAIVGSPYELASAARIRGVLGRTAGGDAAACCCGLWSGREGGRGEGQDRSSRGVAAGMGLGFDGVASGEDKGYEGNSGRWAWSSGRMRAGLERKENWARAKFLRETKLGARWDLDG